MSWTAIYRYLTYLEQNCKGNSVPSSQNILLLLMRKHLQYSICSSELLILVSTPHAMPKVGREGKVKYCSNSFKHFRLHFTYEGANDIRVVNRAEYGNEWQQWPALEVHPFALWSSSHSSLPVHQKRCGSIQVVVCAFPHFSMSDNNTSRWESNSKLKQPVERQTKTDGPTGHSFCRKCTAHTSHSLQQHKYKQKYTRHDQFQINWYMCIVDGEKEETSTSIVKSSSSSSVKKLKVLKAKRRNQGRT